APLTRSKPIRSPAWGRRFWPIYPDAAARVTRYGPLPLRLALGAPPEFDQLQNGAVRILEAEPGVTVGIGQRLGQGFHPARLELLVNLQHVVSEKGDARDSRVGQVRVGA